MKTSDRYRKITRRISFVTIVANLSGALLTFLYSLGTRRETGPSATNSFGSKVGLLILVSAGLLILGNILSSRCQAPLWDWYRRATSGEASPPAPTPVRRLALNLAPSSAMISMTMWVLAGLVFGLISGLEESSFDWDSFFHLPLAIIVVAGPVTAIIIYFAVEQIWRGELVLFFSKGTLVQEPVFRMTVRRRLLVLFVTTTMSLVDLALLSYFQAQRIANSPQPTALLPGFLSIELIFVGTSILITIVLALTLGASLVEPLEKLSRRMTAVQEGDLDQRMPVTSNDELGQVSDHFNHMIDDLKRRNTELQTMYQISQDISASLELDQTLQTVLEQVGRIIPYDGAEICLYEEQEELLRVQAWTGSEQILADTRGHTYELGEGYTGWIGEHQQSLLIPDVDLHPQQPATRQIADGIVLNGFLGVPLLVAGNIVGTLEIVSTHKGALNEHDRQLLETIAPQAAVAIHNAAQVLERERQLKQQIAELRIEIDRTKQARQVAEITESDYFQELRSKVRRMRKGLEES